MKTHSKCLVFPPLSITLFLFCRNRNKIIQFLLDATKGRRHDERCFSHAVTFSDISDGLGEYNVITIKECFENKIV